MAEKKKRKKDRLIQEDENEDNGVTNPVLETEAVLGISGGESSAAEMTADEAQEAEHLIKDMKSKHRHKQKELSKVKSPKDDLAKELRTVKKRSKAKIDETLRQQEEELAALSYREDGTLPMPGEEGEETARTEEGEEAPPTETTVTFAEPEPTEEEKELEDKVKKLKKKKEKVEEEEVSAFEAPPETPRAEPEQKEEEEAVPPAPTTPTSAPEEEAKTPRSMSMKARMKDRLRKAKEEAEAKVEQEAQEERRERRLQRDKQQKLTRFDTDIDEAELERMADERQKQLKVRWKKMGRQTEDRLRSEMKEKGVFMPTPEEAYDFFTREFEPEPDEEPPKEEVKEEEEKKEEEEEKPEGEEGEEDEEKKKDKKDKPEDEEPLIDADDVDEEGYGMYAWRRPEYDDSKETLDKQMAVLYYPEISTVPPEEKVFGEEKEPRFLEDEGLYVGIRPKMSGWNLNKMEHRLLKERESKLRKGGGNWFGEDGRMLALPDPLRPSPSRPPIPEEQEEGLEVQFQKAIVREFDSRYIDGTPNASGFYQLDIDINSLVFSHHHLFSREHVLANKLNELYDEYVLRRSLNMADYLTEKLKTAKKSALHLREHMAAHKSEHDYADRANFERRLLDYKYQIKTGREMRDREQRRDRELLKQIINIWKELKAERTKQNHINCPEKLTITREEVDKEKDQMIWKMEIEDELEEIREERQEEYERKMAEYNEELKAYQAQQEAKKEAAARKRKREKNAKGSKASLGSRASKQSKDNDPSPEEIAKDEEIINEPDYPQPDKPEPPDDTVSRDQIVAKAKEIRRRPGEPKLYLELTNTQTITPTQDCPRGEQSRRDDVSKCKVFVKILFNNKEVSRSDSRPLSQEFKVNFGQIFNLKIVQWPENIILQLYEQRGFSTEMLAELNAKIPDASVSSKSVHLEDMSVECNLKVSHSHNGVGSGVSFPFTIKGLEDTTLITRGKLNCSVGWAVDENGELLVPPSTQITEGVVSAMRRMEGMADPIADLGLDGVNDPEKVAKWLDEKRIDPNDPKYADLFYNYKSKGSDPSSKAPVEYYRLEQLQQEFDFCEDEFIEENRRFKLIKLRDDEVQEFKNYKMVPLQERDIPRDTFMEYDKKKREEEKITDAKDIEAHRQVVSKFMQRVREQVIRRFRRLAHQKRLEDVVSEDAVPNIAMIGTSLLKLTERRRPLRVERKERKKVSAQNLRPEDVSILVSINRAIFVPVRASRVRREGQSGATTSRGDETSRQVKNIVGDPLVQPFVEVMFQHVSMRTSVGTGPNPSFNEELKLPFNAPNEDYSPANLQQINENIYLNLFDEVVVDISEDDRQRDTTVHKRIEKKWLGSLTIPFSTVYFNGKIEGTFKLNKPPVLLGYSRDDEEEESLAKRKSDTYISLFVTIEPALQTAEPMKERFTTNESEVLLEYAEKWQAELASKFPKREFKTSVIDVNGKTVFVTRYLKKLQPPDLVIEMGNSDQNRAEFVARFVSLIPSVSDNVVFPGLCDIWSTCDQFMKWMTGDEEEHAVLLANFFLHMNKETWLVIGTAIPEGPTAYVMTKEGDEFWFWNAGTGEHFSKRDAYCPLQTVGCVINQDNIWGNIQQYQKPSQMTFDLNNKSAWKPFFQSGFSNPGLSSCQPEKLYYKDTNERAVGDLQEKIEQLLKNKIMEWRSRQITRWNRHCTQIMRRLLPNLEQNVGKGADQSHIDELEQSFKSYKVSGFPINLAYSEISSITEAVYSTGVHSQESSDVEFAIAVYIHPYPNDVLSVWVYVASLIRLR